MTYKDRDIGYYFVVMASVIILLAGVKAATQVIVPLLLSLFLAIILTPMFNFFRQKRIPDTLSLIITISIFIIGMGLVVKLVGSSVTDFRSNIGFYEQQLSKYFVSIEIVALKYGLELPFHDLPSLLSTKQIMSYTSGFIQTIGSLFTNGFIILLTLIFMLLESKHFANKLAFADRDRGTTQHIEKIFSKIKEYMVLKAVISLATGIIIWIALLIVGTDYAFLWGVVAFLLNFIPNIGSILAAVVPVLLTLVQLGGLSALVVVALYAAINIVVGSIIEPKIMGRGLGLSTLVVFISLLFWGWLLGTTGMLLSIPLTIMAKIIFDANDDTKWIAVMLDSGEDINESVNKN